MKKIKINNNLSIGTILQRIACIDELNTLLQTDIVNLLDAQGECCDSGLSLSNEEVTLDGETILL